MRGFFRLGQALRHLAGFFRFHVWYLEGEERETRTPLRIIYAGRVRGKAHISRMAFFSPPGETDRGIHWLPAVLRSSGRRGTRFPLMLVETHRKLYRIFRRPCDHFVPAWISTALDLSTGRLRMSKQKGIISDMKKCRSLGLTSEISSDPKMLDFFYHRMYLPYIKAAHGDSAAFAAVSWLKKHASRGELALIKQEGKPIAGIFRLFKNSEAGVVLIGLLDGDPDILKRGVTALIYADSIEHIGRRGYRKMRLGDSRAFIFDGALQYKRKWGAHVTGAKPGGYWIRLRESTAGARAFLINNPFIFEERGRLLRAAFLQEGIDRDSAALADLEKRLRISGVPDLRLFRFDAFEEALAPPALPHAEVRFETVRPLHAADSSEDDSIAPKK